MPHHYKIPSIATHYQKKKNPAESSESELADAWYCYLRISTSLMHYALVRFAEPSTVQASRRLNGP